MKVIKQKFYERSPEIVAKELLGKLLVRKYKGKIISGMIVETEAYFGSNDPASRAFKGKNKISELMFDEPGRALIYMVHANWLLNITCLPKGIPGAVLIRAIEPIEGVEIMKKLRKVSKLKELTNGPGKLTKALAIGKSLHGVYVFKKSSPLIIITFKNFDETQIGRSKRIGVKVDLEKPFRFFVKENEFVSKK
ncbi:MAG: DNA-3-methyladenine glycosylase [Candidatus Aenigmarchaeota archaeon]|nr:DNA-3-methyladenine glycosylase [Candidatus Aenigmarchaeota archaeon]